MLEPYRVGQSGWCGLISTHDESWGFLVKRGHFPDEGEDDDEDVDGMSGMFMHWMAMELEIFPRQN